MNTLLETHELTLAFPQKNICRHLNIKVMPGEIWGMLGTNGSGKTTLLHTLAGWHKTSGKITFLGKDLTSLKRTYIAKHLGLLLQDQYEDFTQTVYERCGLGRYPHRTTFSWITQNDKKIIEKALEDMELLDLSQQNTQTLSGGERQRLSIATLLTQNPRLYLLDEPTNHLDVYFQIKILQHFKNLAKQENKSIIMSLHDIHLAAHFCDMILMLGSDGRYFAGPPIEILTEENLLHVFKYPIKRMAIKHSYAWIPLFENEINS